MSISTYASWAGYCVAAYALYYVGFAIYHLYFHPLAKFEGPKLWAVSRIPWAYHTIKGDLWQVLGRLHEEYGPILRVAPDELTVIDPDGWKTIYTARPLYLKDPHSQTQPLNGAHSLFTAEGTIHRRIRAVLSHSFADKSLRAQAPIIEMYASQLMARIRRESGDGKALRQIDLTKLYGYAAFDTITDLSLGEPLSPGLKDMNEHGWIQGYFFHATFSAIRIALSRFAPLDAFLGFFFLGVTRQARQRNWRIINSALTRRMDLTKPKQSAAKRSDLLTPLMDRLDERGQNGITKAEMFSNALAFVIAGTQLNTNILSTATFLLLQNPAKWQALAHEVRGHFSDASEITVESTEDLKYLHAVINETLRIRHPTPINLPRIVPDSGCSINGRLIPGGVVVGINLQNIQNASTLWVAPNEFHPERFLDAQDQRYEPRFDRDSKEAFAPFSTGPRNCIGSRLFFAQVRLLLAQVAWNFDLLQHPCANLHENWLEQKAWFAFEPRALLVTPVRRASPEL